MFDPSGQILANVFNFCIRCSKIPHSWKEANVAMIHKKGDTADIHNWRPISICRSLYRIFMRLLSKRLTTYLVSNDLLSPTQAGFLPVPGCSNHNLVLDSIISRFRRNLSRKHLSIVWLDLTKAFDTIPLDLIWTSCARKGIAPEFIQLLKDSFDGTHLNFFSRLSAEPITVFPTRGIKQGCPISPILFNIGIDALLFNLRNTVPGISFGPCSANHLCFADDLVLFANNPAEMRALLSECERFAVQTHMTFSIPKCATLCLERRPSSNQNHFVNPGYYLQGALIPALTKVTDSYKYLGLDKSFYRNSISSAIDDLTRKAKLLFSSPLAPWDKVDAYRKFVFPTITYILQQSPVINISQLEKADQSIRVLAKAGLHLPHETSNHFVHLPVRLNGLGIPSLAAFHACSVASRSLDALTSQVPLVRFAVLDSLSDTVSRRSDLDPSAETFAAFLNSAPGDDEVHNDHLTIWSQTRFFLYKLGVSVSIEGPVDDLLVYFDDARSSSIRQILVNKSNQLVLNAWRDQQEQGQYAFFPQGTNVNLFSKGSKIPYRAFSFLVRARLHLLPTRTHQQITGTLAEGVSPNCRRCGEAKETLAHVFGNCRGGALTRARDRHMQVVAILKDSYRLNHNFLRGLSATWDETVPEVACEPPLALLRPDLVLRSFASRTMTIIDVKTPVDVSPDCMHTAHQNNLSKYLPIKTYLEEKGWNVSVHTFAVGCFGSWLNSINDPVCSALHLSKSGVRRVKYLCSTSNVTSSYFWWKEFTSPVFHNTIDDSSF
jgi:hypothetical protein